MQMCPGQSFNQNAVWESGLPTPDLLLAVTLSTLVICIFQILTYSHIHIAKGHNKPIFCLIINFDLHYFYFSMQGISKRRSIRQFYWLRNLISTKVIFEHLSFGILFTWLIYGIQNQGQAMQLGYPRGQNVDLVYFRKMAAILQHIE